MAAVAPPPGKSSGICVENRPVAETVIDLLTHLESGDVLFIAGDEPRAEEITTALKGGAPDAVILFCPGSDALPGDSAPPSPANTGQRTAALRQLRTTLSASDRPFAALISTGEAVARLYPSPENFDSAPPIVKGGDRLDLESLAEELQALGYVADDRVDEPGEYAVRGQVIDIYPADSGQPYRIEIEDGRIASIRPYDAATQLTSGECDSLELGRAAEPELGKGVTLLEHLPDAKVAIEETAEKRRKRYLALAADSARRRPERAFRDICSDELWQKAIADRKHVEPSSFEEPPPRLVEEKYPERAFKRLATASFDEGERLVLLGTSRDLRFLGQRAKKAIGDEPQPLSRWSEVLKAPKGTFVSLPMPLSRGFRQSGIVALAAADLLGSRAQRSEESTGHGNSDFFDFSTFRTGDVVVHEDHGIAVVTGLEPLPDSGGDAVVLRFAGEARRLVPVGEAHKLWRYGADENAVTLDKLDGSTWQKRRVEVSAAIAETARGLVAIASERMKQSAPVLEPDAAAYERFVSGFPFSETTDQLKAIQAVQSDLACGKPMDRLVVGDVGFGKTEVALRAAAITALAGRQVALAAPTTVLVRQHLETFKSRFEDLGLEVASLSRFSTPAEKKRVAAGLKDGSIRIVIGTSALAGKTIGFKDLALVIIDEEQKFGTADKAKLRDLGAGHVLSLSATPIPRTLQSALIGLQQLSVIATPPARRQPIRTTIGKFDAQNIRTALLRERSRGGQSFFVVPRIEEIQPMREQLAKIVPELNLLQAHGKMPVAEIDEAMVGFASGQGDILLATNIIEAGLDVPRANTMIVWRADRFGLSQLHQLRGRVGRGARRGQIYLLTPADSEIAPRTLSRLSTLQAFDRLGAGFAISARDLDVRGAGDLLSDEQTGHVKLIGVDLYQHLLERALREARGERVDEYSPSLNVGVEGGLPPQWIPDEEVRLELYLRLARIKDVKDLEAFGEELSDRFGAVPEEAEQLLSVAKLRLLALAAGIEKIDAGPAAIALTPHSPMAGLPQSLGLEAKEGRLLHRAAIDDPIKRLEATEALLEALVESAGG